MQDTSLEEIIKIRNLILEAENVKNNDKKTAIFLLEDALQFLEKLQKNEKCLKLLSILRKKINALNNKLSELKNKTNETVSPPLSERILDSLVGCEEAKLVLKETCLYPKLFPELFSRERQPFRSVLLFGPPGTGKTHLVELTAKMSGRTLFGVSAADVCDKFVGESEKNVRKIFKQAKDAKSSLLFFDELDALFRKRTDRDSQVAATIKTEFLLQLNKMDINCVFIGATNLPWALDSAFVRRFDRIVFVGLLNEEQVLLLLKEKLGEQVTDSLLKKIAKQFSPATGSDVELLTKNLIYQPIRELMAAKSFVKTGSVYRIGDEETVTYRELKERGETIEEPKLDEKVVLGVLEKTQKTIPVSEQGKYIMWMEKVNLYK